MEQAGAANHWYSTVGMLSAFQCSLTVPGVEEIPEAYGVQRINSDGLRCAGEREALQSQVRDVFLARASTNAES